MKSPKFTDAGRYRIPYVPVSEQGDGYLQKRFEQIRQQQKDEAAARLKNVIQRKFSK